MKKNTFLFLAFVFLVIHHTQAQDQKTLDSLNTVYKTAKHDTTKIMALVEIAFEYRNSKPDTCIFLATQALEKSEKIAFEKGKGWAINRIARGKIIKNDFDAAINLLPKAQIHFEKANDKKGLAWNYLTWGLAYRGDNKPTLALEYFQKSLKIYEEIRDKKGIGAAFVNLGSIYDIQGNYPLALEYYQKRLKVVEEIRDKKGIASLLLSIGNIYVRQGNYPKALEYYQKSLKIYEEIGEKGGIAACLGNIGLFYRSQDYGNPLALEYFQKSLKIFEEIGDKSSIAITLGYSGSVYSYQGNYPKALEYSQKSLKIFEEIGDKGSIGAVLSSIGDIYLKQGNYPLALEYFQKSMKILEEAGDKEWLAIALNGIAELYQKQKDYDKSIEYAQRSLQIAKERKVPISISDASKILFESYKLKGNYAKALEYHELYKQTQDSLFSTEKSKAIANLETQAEMDKKQLEIDKQQLEIEKEKEATKFQQYINYLVIAGLLSVLVFAFFIFRSRQKERKAKELVLQQKEEIQQINEELNTTLSIVEQERAKSDKLLLNILPIETARELKETGQATPQHYDLVSVLFTDFKGFTSLAEKMTPSEVIENLDTCFYALDLICDKYNLEKIKTIGDSYMCAGGLPVANTSNPMDTVLAGLEMQAFMTKWKSEKEAQGLPAWELRLGIHSGEAVAGVVGKNKFAYDIWGDTVNLASRMESSGEVGKVNISEMTYNLVKHQFQCTYRGEIQAKNKGEVKMYFVEGEL